MTALITSSPRDTTRRRFSPRGRRPLLVALVLAGLFALAALVPFVLATYDPTAQNFADALRPPSLSHWFGTDEAGRDLYGRVIYGTRESLLIGVGASRLAVRDLRVGFARGTEVREVVRGVSFTLDAGRCVAIVGESGSGKSVTARTIAGLIGAHAVVEAEYIRLGGHDLTALSDRAWRGIRGRRIGFIQQDALVSLDPLRPVGREIEEALRIHGWNDRASRRRKAVELLASVDVPHPDLDRVTSAGFCGLRLVEL